MPFGAKTTASREALPKPEILATPLETNVIESAVLRAAGVAADTEGPYEGRRYLLAGTVLSKRGDSTYEEYTGAEGQAIAGILFETVEFADATSASNEPAAFLRRNVSFDLNKIVDFEGLEADLKAWAEGPGVNCEFVDAKQKNVTGA